jgi:hypothetical protein
LPAASAAKEFVYSSSQLDLKTVVPVKGQSGIHRLICLSAQTHIPSLPHTIRKAQRASAMTQTENILLIW